MKILRFFFLAIGLCSTLYVLFVGAQHLYLVKQYKNKCASVETGMTLDEAAKVLGRNSYYELMEDCQIRFVNDRDRNKMIIIMPASLLSSTPPEISVDLASMSVATVSCEDH